MTSKCVEKNETVPIFPKIAINYTQKIDITMEVIRLHYY